MILCVLHSLVIFALFFVVPVAQAQVFGLVCSGTISVYESDPRELNVPAGATTVDLDGHVLSTPVGKFHITKADEQAIYFDDPSGPLKVFGYIDRFTGDLTIFWRRPEEEAKLLAGREAIMSRYAKLRCVPSERLF